MRTTTASPRLLRRAAGTLAVIAVAATGVGAGAAPASAQAGVRACYTDITAVNGNRMVTMWTQPKGKTDCKSKDGHPEVTARSVRTVLQRYGGNQARSRYTTPTPLTCEDFGGRFAGLILEQGDNHDVCRYLGSEKQKTVTWVKFVGRSTKFRVVNWSATQVKSTWDQFTGGEVQIKSCWAWNARAMRGMTASNGARYDYRDFKVAGAFGPGIPSTWSAGALCR